MQHEYSTAVFIGRFQPFHNSHLEVVTRGLEIADKVVIVVGSSTSARSIKNPFTFDERVRMIQDSIDSKDRGRVAIEGVRDYFYSFETWLASVQAVTDQHIVPGSSVALLGSFKDASSYYLRSFPQWDHVPTLAGTIHATDLRELLYNSAADENGHVITDWEDKLGHPPSVEWIKFLAPNAVKNNIEFFVTTPVFANLAKSYQQNENYKKSWDSAPFPPIFVTTDCVVVCSGHVLVVKRKFHPGKGLFALPGGFLKQDETIRVGALRELKEETGIRVDKLILDSSIEAERVFDYPFRSERGRTITHAFYIKLKDGVLPEVKGNDDAEGAMWLPLWDVSTKEDQFFEDHAHIIHAFTGGSL